MNAKSFKGKPGHESRALLYRGTDLFPKLRQIASTTKRHGSERMGDISPTIVRVASRMRVEWHACERWSSPNCIIPCLSVPLVLFTVTAAAQQNSPTLDFPAPRESAIGI